ncbi:hypothetical protein LTR84_005503 [Exophiala bonariae]|uniref:Uncharacterized protein n=1 Tax=Exophiala bonariae TaxID=1690606 RepID=A0AAV9N3W9_9EURO|nr:hypothetical protein LTR84_005503 [Exophiala bonariae]
MSLFPILGTSGKSSSQNQLHRQHRTTKEAQRNETLHNYSNIGFDNTMFSLVYLLLAITTSVLAAVDPTITPAPGSDTLAAIHSTPPLSPDDLNYVYEEPYTVTTANSTGAVLQKRTPPVGIYVCELPDWKGTCKWVQVKNNAPCMDFPWQAGVSIGLMGFNYVN